MAKKKASKKKTESKDLVPRGPGRPPGAPNKKTLQVQEILALKDIDLVGALTDILFPSSEIIEERKEDIRMYLEMGVKPPAHLFGMDDVEKAKLILKLMEYIYPKRRSIDIKADVDLHNVKANRPTLQDISKNPAAFEAIETICEVIK